MDPSGDVQIAIEAVRSEAHNRQLGPTKCKRQLATVLTMWNGKCPQMVTWTLAKNKLS
jgi:hypothetical protein